MARSLPVVNNPRPVAQPDLQALPESERRLWQALLEVNDPEYPVSLVDMGLVYGVRREGSRVVVDLTLTAMGCPCMDMILEDVRNRLLQEEDVEDVQINIVWDPPWTRDRLSETAIKKFRSWGVSV